MPSCSHPPLASSLPVDRGSGYALCLLPPGSPLPEVLTSAGSPGFSGSFPVCRPMRERERSAENADRISAEQYPGRERGCRVNTPASLCQSSAELPCGMLHCAPPGSSHRAALPCAEKDYCTSCEANRNMLCIHQYVRCATHGSMEMTPCSSIWQRVIQAHNVDSGVSSTSSFVVRHVHVEKITRGKEQTTI
jgi:hypothetical protein